MRGILIYQQKKLMKVKIINRKTNENDYTFKTINISDKIDKFKNKNGRSI